MHCITFVADDEMPEGHDFVFVEIPEGALLFYRESELTEENLMDSWAAYRALQRRPPVEPASAPSWTRLLHSVA